MLKIVFEIIDCHNILGAQKTFPAFFIVEIRKCDSIKHRDYTESKRAGRADLDPNPVAVGGPRGQQRYKLLAFWHFAEYPVFKIIALLNVENIKECFTTGQRH